MAIEKVNNTIAIQIKALSPWLSLIKPIGIQHKNQKIASPVPIPFTFDTSPVLLKKLLCLRSGTPQLVHIICNGLVTAPQSWQWLSPCSGAMPQPGQAMALSFTSLEQVRQCIIATFLYKQ